MKQLFFTITAIFLLSACCKEEESTTNPDAPEASARRTIIVYFNAENNISSDANNDLNEIKEGSKNLPSDCNLIVYMDNVESYDATTGKRKLPYICKIAEGKSTTVKTMSQDFDSSDPEIMKTTLQWIINKYPAQSLAMAFWGHGTGPFFTNDTVVVSRAYGADNNQNSVYAKMSSYKWINIPEMAQLLNKLTKSDGSQAHLDYLFFDACLMQSVEVAYEFRNTADYIIGSCCETPVFGAPYTDMIPIMAQTDVEQTAKDMVNTYIDKNTWGTVDDQSDGVCISAVKTSKLDNLLSVTKSALDTISTYSTSCPLNISAHYDSYPNVTSCIFYYLTKKYSGEPIFYDMNDVMMHNLSTTDYDTWRKALDEAIIAKRHPRDITQLSGNMGDWVPATLAKSNGDYRYYFKMFLLNDNTFGGLSMIVPRTVYNTTTSPNVNETMYKYQWWQKIMPQWHL